MLVRTVNQPGRPCHWSRTHLGLLRADLGDACLRPGSPCDKSHPWVLTKATPEQRQVRGRAASHQGWGVHIQRRQIVDRRVLRVVAGRAR